MHHCQPVMHPSDTQAAMGRPVVWVINASATSAATMNGCQAVLSALPLLAC